MNEQILVKLGLTEKEVKLYLALLQLGTSTMNRIAEISNYPRTTCYDIIRTLIGKGLVSYVISDKIRHYEAADPEILSTKLEEQKKLLNDALPELKELYKSRGAKPKVELYEGKQGVKDILDKVITEGKQLHAFAVEEKNIGLPDWFVQQFVLRRKKAGVHNKVIAEDSASARSQIKKDKENLSTTKIDKVMAGQNAECYVFGDKVAFVTMSDKEPIGVLIENKDIAELQKAIFERVWEK